MPHVLFLMDPIDTLSLKKDSTIAMINAAQDLGFRISYARQEDLMLIGDHVEGQICDLSLTEAFRASLEPTAAAAFADSGAAWYEMGKSTQQRLDDVDVVMMRKDPPFNMEFIYSTYLLERLEREGTLIVNKPSSLRDCNEKLFATEFSGCCPELLVSRRMDKLRAFHSQHNDVIY